MIRAAPDAAELLAIARQELLAEVLPALDDDLRYQVLMIANGMKIAQREITEGPAIEERARNDIASFYQALAPDHVPIDPTDPTDEVRLAADIRERRIPGSDQRLPDQRLHRLLLSLTRGKLEVSNPKYLKQAPE